MMIHLDRKLNVLNWHYSIYVLNFAIIQKMFSIVDQFFFFS